jgi:hypothetical protein
MPLTKKGEKIKAVMQKEYGKDRGESVFYASINKGTIKGPAAEGRASAEKKSGGHKKGK